MTNTRTNSIVGAALILVGALFLLQTMGLVPMTSTVFWSGLFILGGLAFLSVLLVNREVWWPAIPGATFLGIGLMMAARAAFPLLPRSWDGAIFLGMLGLGFVIVYLLRPANWWAIIPAGTLLTLSVVAAAATGRRGAEGGTIFLLGLGLTFVLVYLVPTPRGRMTWALIPATVLLILGGITAAATSATVNAVWPALLIAAGVYLVYRAVTPGRG